MSAPIISPPRVVAPVLWDVDVDIRQALERELAPATCPPECTYVPTGIRNRLLTWAHTTVVAGHPSTIQSISEKYCRRMSLVMSTSVPYVPNPNPPNTPAGKLLPLPMSQCPWSHLSIDFVTDLPSSGGFTTMLVIVDRFSKSCHFIPLSGLHTTLQVTEALFQQVFWH